MKGHVEWNPKGEHEDHGHQGDVDKLVEYLLEHLHIQTDHGELMEFEEQPDPGHKHRHGPHPPLPLGCTQTLLQNGTGEEEGGEEHGYLDVEVGPPVAPEAPVEVPLESTFVTVGLEETVEPPQEIQTAQNDGSSS